jgi:DnaJ domain
MRTAGPSATTAPLGGAPYVHRQGYLDIPFVKSPAFAKATAGKLESRPRRALNAPMRAALEVLRSAGAVDLADDFLPAELKAAFRRLARGAHPDMHPRASEHDRHCQIARFREIREAYRVLSAAPRN